MKHYAIANAFKKGEITGNDLPEVAPVAKGAAAVIDLKNAVGLGQVMDGLCNANSTIIGTELKGFISGATSDYNIDGAIISSWAPNVSNTMVFTRIVIQNTDTSKENAVLYIVYTGFKNDAGNGAWNRNISYFGSETSNDLWDLTYHDPVIDLSKIGEIKLEDGTTISKDSTSEQILASNYKIANELRDYMAENYILNYNGNFKISSSNETVKIGKFDDKGLFQENKAEAAIAKSANVELNDSESDAGSSTDTTLKNNNNVIFVQFVIQTETGKNTSASQNTGVNGIYKGFYITGYKIA